MGMVFAGWPEQLGTWPFSERKRIQDDKGWLREKQAARSGLCGALLQPGQSQEAERAGIL
jgi:hypothetical protein